MNLRIDTDAEVDDAERLTPARELRTTLRGLDIESIDHATVPAHPRELMRLFQSVLDQRPDR